MALLDQDSGCCGASFRKNNITLLGLMTLAFPIFIAARVLSFLLLAFRGYRFTFFSKIKTIEEASARLIVDFNLLPKLKCFLSAKLMNLSPRVSGFIFKNFNFMILFAPFLFVGWVVAWL